MRTISRLVNFQNGQVKRGKSPNNSCPGCRLYWFIFLMFARIGRDLLPSGGHFHYVHFVRQTAETRRTARFFRLHLVQITSHQSWRLQGRGLIKFMYTCGFPHVRVSPNLSVGGRFSLFARRDVALPPPRRPITALIDGPSFLSAFWRRLLLK